MARAKRGRPSFEPTKAQREQVGEWSAAGIPHEIIAQAIGVGIDTLKKYFSHELDFGRHQANVKVAKSLFQMATQEGNVAAAIFWLKTRAGWKEKQEEPKPNPQVHFHTYSGPRPSRYSPEDKSDEE